MSKNSETKTSAEWNVAFASFSWKAEYSLFVSLFNFVLKARSQKRYGT
jgi:hypothetical protein